MVQAWENPIGGFTKGFLGGLQIANQRKQLAMQQSAQELDKALKAIEVNSKLLANKSIPNTMKANVMKDTTNAYNFIAKRINPNHEDLVFDGNIEPEDIDFSKRAGGLVEQWKNKELEDPHFIEAFNALQSEIFSKNEPTDAQRIIASQVVPKLEQGIVSGADMRTNTPLMQALRGTSGDKAKGLEENLTNRYTGELMSSYMDPSVPSDVKPSVIQELSRVSPELAQRQQKIDLERQQNVFKEENQGVWQDTGYLTSDGQPITRNTRTKRYSDGVSEFSQLPKEAYRKEGLKRADEESLSGAVKTFSLLDGIDTTLSAISTGVPRIGEARNAIRRYLNDEQAQNFAVATDQLSMLGNEIIKGVPSNFDIELYRKTLPNANYPYSENVKRVNKIRDMLKTGFDVKIQNLRKARMPIPQDVLEAASKLGVFENKKSDKKGTSSYVGNPIKVGGFTIREKKQ